MSSQTSGERYILFLPSAVENLERLDNSLCIRIKNEIEKFQTAWNPSQIFDKDVRNTEIVKQIKKDRGVMRSFAAWWDGGSVHVLCVLAIYKKQDENDYWNQTNEYLQRAQSIFDKLSKYHENGDIYDKMVELDELDDYKVIYPE